eukprot:1183775-Alexandrium_andersonii.AAC.1
MRTRFWAHARACGTTATFLRLARRHARACACAAPPIALQAKMLARRLAAHLNSPCALPATRPALHACVRPPGTTSAPLVLDCMLIRWTVSARPMLEIILHTGCARLAVGRQLLAEMLLQ